MKCKLTKIDSVHKNLRTTSVEGDLVELPEIGNRVNITAPPLDKTKDLRLVSTSIIVNVTVTAPDVYEIDTLNSKYKLEICQN